MSHLNLDIIYEILDQTQAAGCDPKSRRAILLSLALACRQANQVVRPILFSKVKWPHPDKHDEKSGLHFFPSALWPYFRYFHFDWPDHWPDATPPRWGTRPGAIYYPKHTDKLEDALPQMSNIHTFQITCPFDPPINLLHSIVRCPNIKDLKITDTPLCTAILPTPPHDFNLEHMTLVSVAEAARVGEGPYDKRHQNITYFMRGYRKKYLRVNGGSEIEDAHFNGCRFFTALCRKETLRSLQISANYFSLLINEFWDPESLCPRLELLILTGATPFYFFDLSEWAISRMPKLTDLRVLLSTTKFADTRSQGAIFSMIAKSERDDPESPSAYAQITSLAISNAYNTAGVLRYMTNLHRLVICTIVSPPRVPIAMGRVEIERLLADLQAGGGNKRLKQIRLISEEDLDYTFVAFLGRICPKLEIVEVERCGYKNGYGENDWTPYGDALSTYRHLRKLRIAIPLNRCGILEHGHPHNSSDNLACSRANRKLCASYLASRIPTLSRIGFEYRSCTYNRRYEDRWLEFDIVRLSDGEVSLVELGPTWYPFPEVWEPAELQE